MKGLHEWKADTLTLRGLNSQTVDEEPPLRSISTVSRGKEYDTDLGCTEVSRGHSRRQVECNKGVCGVDGMESDKLRDFLKLHGTDLRKVILEGSYQPSPVRRVEIPKVSGGIRRLGLPR